MLQGAPEHPRRNPSPSRKSKSKSKSTSNSTLLCLDTTTSAPAIQPSTAAPSPPPTNAFCGTLDTNPTNGHRYAFVTADGELTWPDANSAAESTALPECCGANAHSATISSDDENTYLFDLAARTVTFDNCGTRRRLPEEEDNAPGERSLQLGPKACKGWIGLSYVPNAAAFQWVTTEPYSGPYIHWGFGTEPNRTDRRHQVPVRLHVLRGCWLVQHQQQHVGALLCRIRLPRPRVMNATDSSWMSPPISARSYLSVPS